MIAPSGCKVGDVYKDCTVDPKSVDCAAEDDWKYEWWWAPVACEQAVGGSTFHLRLTITINESLLSSDAYYLVKN